MVNVKNPFQAVAAQLKTEPIPRFQRSTPLTKRYLETVQGRDIRHLFIGWICKRDSFFAYVYKRMKREAKETHTTSLASEIAKVGFPILLPQIGAWIAQSRLPVLAVPVPSRHGVSERFAHELCNLLNQNFGYSVQVKEALIRADRLGEMKRIKSWITRSRTAGKLLALGQTGRLSHSAILLVDDIVTSGSSLRTAARLLKSLGAHQIAAASLSTNLFDSTERSPTSPRVSTK